MSGRAAVKRRFLGFAGGHLVLSVLGHMAAWMVLLLIVATGAMWALAAGLMLLYVPVGALAARAGKWPLPGRREGALAVLLPALCAWVWAFGGWALLTAGLDPLSVVSAYLLLSTALLASPSFYMMLAILTDVPGGMGDWALLWYGGIFLAGLLPPLLFFLGSLLGARRHTPENEDEKGGEMLC